MQLIKFFFSIPPPEEKRKRKQQNRPPAPDRWPLCRGTSSRSMLSALEVDPTLACLLTTNVSPSERVQMPAESYPLASIHPHTHHKERRERRGERGGGKATCSARSPAPPSASPPHSSPWTRRPQCRTPHQSRAQAHHCHHTHWSPPPSGAPEAQRRDVASDSPS